MNTVQNATASKIGKVRIVTSVGLMANAVMVNQRETVVAASVEGTGSASIAISVEYIVQMESQIMTVLDVFALVNGLEKNVTSVKCPGPVGMGQYLRVPVILVSVQRMHSGRAAFAMFVGSCVSMDRLRKTAGDASVKVTGVEGGVTSAL